MSGKSTQGFEFKLETESVLGTAGGSPFHIRLAENPTVPLIENMLAEVNTRGFSHFADSDQPTTYQGLQENAVTLPMHILRAGTNNVYPPLVVVAESAGFAVSTEPDDSATAAGSDVDKTQLGGITGNPVGQPFLCYDSGDDTWWPALGAYQDGNTVHWLFDQPSTPSDGDLVLNMYGLTPSSGEVGGTKTLTMKFTNRASYSGNDYLYTFKGCACGSMGTLELEPYSVPTLSPTFHVLDVTKQNTTLGAEAFRDSGVRLTTGGLFYCGVGDAQSAYSVSSIDRSNSQIKMQKASIEMGVTTTAVPGTGGLNDVQCYLSQFDPSACSVSITALMPAAYASSLMAEWDKHADAGTLQTEKAIQIVQGVSGDSNTAPGAPCWGFWAPRCYLAEPPMHDPFSEAFHTITYKYRPTPSALGSDFGATNAPFTLGIYNPTS